MGPVQVLVVGFDRPTFSGEVLAELDRLRQAGVVRLVDVLLVRRAEDGSLDTLPAPDGRPAEMGRVAAAVLGQRDGEAADASAKSADTADSMDTWSLADVVPVGSTAAVALIEHLWAGPLADAVQRAGGVPLQETWLAADDVRLLERLAEESDEELR